MYKKICTGSMIALFTSTLSCSLHAQTETTQQITQDHQDALMSDVKEFSVALELIKQYYVKPVNEHLLFQHAIRGMLSSLDAHSAFLNESDFKELASTTEGNFGGLGLEVTMEHDAIKVITALVDTPAYKAGIKPGDYIIKIGSHIVQGMDLKSAVSLMRGAPGSMVELTVIRTGTAKPILFNLKREKIEVKSVQSKLLDNQYGYVRLTQFQVSTDQDMQKAIAALQARVAPQKLKGLILDLRNNPGGLLDSAIQVSGAFLNKMKDGKQEVIVSTKGRLPGSKFVAYANSQDILNNAPMVVLINSGSASAAEIVSGALQDNHRAVLVGTRSFGKGSVQTVLPLDQDHGIKLTTALYYTPSGKSIQAEGITPDIIIAEVSISKKPVDNSLAGFSEAGLWGHIDNAQSAKEKQKAQASVADDAKLQQEDYQLYSALMILKGLSTNPAS